MAACSWLDTVGEGQQHVAVARLPLAAPAREVLAAQFCQVHHSVLYPERQIALERRDGIIRRHAPEMSISLSHQRDSYSVWIAPTRTAPDVDRSLRHPPSLRALSLDALRYHGGRHRGQMCASHLCMISFPTCGRPHHTPGASRVNSHASCVSNETSKRWFQFGLLRLATTITSLNIHFPSVRNAASNVSIPYTAAICISCSGHVAGLLPHMRQTTRCRLMASPHNRTHTVFRCRLQDVAWRPCR